MTGERYTLQEIVAEFNEVTRSLSRALVATRSLDYLKRSAEAAQKAASRLRGFKEGARLQQDEYAANILLGMQCFASALAAEITMWVELRAGTPHAAWNSLIDAQEYLTIAAQGCPAEAIDAAQARVDKYEKMLFPHMVFASCGLLYKSGICNICEQTFAQCEHDEGRIYLGRVCREEEVQDVRLLEISLVPEPRDKRCIAVAIEDEDGRMRDVFTWDVVDEDRDETDRIGGKRMNFLGYSFKQLEGVYH